VFENNLLSYLFTKILQNNMYLSRFTVSLEPRSNWYKKLGIMIHQYKSKFGGKRMLEQNIEFSLLGIARWFKSFYFICITLYILKLFLLSTKILSTHG